ncbi:MAG: PAS domain-containing protein [Gallionellaceae bacterium]|nr:PAS domain-containing protein [Gallionellaceae bacterium]
MKPKTDWIEKRQALRTDAARMLSNLSPAENTAQPEEVMLHELLVHKVELEMQVEELRRAHAEMEEARDHYAEFYELAPIGYITLDRECLIGEINLTGAELLGMDRGKLIHRRFSMFVAPQDRDRWDLVFVGLMKGSEFEKQTLALEMMRADNDAFRAYLDCRRLRSVEGAPRLRLALFDISKIEQAKSEILTPPPDSKSKNMGT